jgi:hypothetical protein
MGGISKDMSEKTHEEMLLWMNETLLKSKAAILFVEHTDGSVEFIRSSNALNFIEYVGLLNWIRTKMNQILAAEIPDENRRP